MGDAPNPSRLQLDFDGSGRDVPCLYCGSTPTHPIEVTPAIYEKGRLVHRPHRGDLCWTCMRRLGISRQDKQYAARRAAQFKEQAAWKRADARAEMKENQLSLFGTELPPDNAITEG